MEPLPDFLRPLEFATVPFPLEVVLETRARREEATPHLLSALEAAAENGWRQNPEGHYYMLHIFAMFLMAEWREGRAYPLIVQLFRDPDYEELTGDIVSESLPSVLASVCGDDLAPIYAMIEDDGLDEWVRSAAVMTLGIVSRDGRLTRADLFEYFGELLTGGLEEESGYVWDCVISECVSFRMVDHLPLIRSAFDRGLADPFCSPLADVEAEFLLPSGMSLYGQQKVAGLFDDTVAELEEWTAFTEEAVLETSLDSNLDEPRLWDPLEVLAPDIPRTISLPVRVEPKPGRNQPCPCGSGLKYKKCCG